jgi:hypothetical protein
MIIQYVVATMKMLFSVYGVGMAIKPFGPVACTYPPGPSLYPVGPIM